MPKKIMTVWAVMSYNTDDDSFGTVTYDDHNAALAYMKLDFNRTMKTIKADDRGDQIDSSGIEGDNAFINLANSHIVWNVVRCRVRSSRKH